MGPLPHAPQGNPITHFLLVHGLFGQPEQWQWLEAELQGRGHTTRALALPRGSWDAEVAFVHGEVMAATEPSVLVGHSMGGSLVRAFAHRHPNVAAGLATIATPPPNPPRYDWGPKVGHVDDDGVYRADVPAFLALAFPGGPPELADLVWEQRRLEGREPEGEPTGSEPRLAILAEDDAAVPYADQQLAAALLRAPTASAPGGHGPHVRHPALVATLLVNWLSPDP